jgi:transcriptional regulator with XRE-family HTH domain
VSEQHIITATEIKAARKLLGWTQEELAAASGVSMPMISFMENNKPRPGKRAFGYVRMALERAGVEFQENEPPRLKR